MPGQGEAMGSHRVFHSRPLGIVSGLQLGLLFASVTRPEQTSASFSFVKQLRNERGDGEHGRREQNPPSYAFTFPLLFLFSLALYPPPPVPFPFLCHPCLCRCVLPSHQKRGSEVPFPTPHPSCFPAFSLALSWEVCGPSGVPRVQQSHGQVFLEKGFL